MDENYGEVSIRILDANSATEVIKCVRNCKKIAITQIKSAIETKKPLPVFRLYGLEHDEFEEKLWKLFRCLENTQNSFEILVEDEVVSKELFRNLMNCWKETGEETEKHIQFEMGFDESDEL